MKHIQARVLCLNFKNISGRVFLYMFRASVVIDQPNVCSRVCV